MNIINTIKQAFTQPTIVYTEDATSSSFILTKEEFATFRAAFKAKANTKQTSAIDILLYNIVRGKDVERGFTPVTNPKKLTGGEAAYHGQRRLIESKHSLRWSFDWFIKGRGPGELAKYYNLTPEQCAKIMEALK